MREHTDKEISDLIRREARLLDVEEIIANGEEQMPVTHATIIEALHDGYCKSEKDSRKWHLFIISLGLIGLAGLRDGKERHRHN